MKPSSTSAAPPPATRPASSRSSTCACPRWTASPSHSSFPPTKICAPPASSLLTPIGKPFPSDEVLPPNVAACCAKPVRQSALFDCLARALTQPAACAATTAEPETRPARSITALPSRKERLLLAEDNAVNQEVALGNLRKLGYTADVVTNGLEVL